MNIHAKLMIDENEDQFLHDIMNVVHGLLLYLESIGESTAHHQATLVKEMLMAKRISIQGHSLTAMIFEFAQFFGIKNPLPITLDYSEEELNNLVIDKLLWARIFSNLLKNAWEAHASFIAIRIDFDIFKKILIIEMKNDFDWQTQKQKKMGGTGLNSLAALATESEFRPDSSQSNLFISRLVLHLS